MTLIETMPLGEVDEDRTDQYLSLKDVRRDLSSFWTLEDEPATPPAVRPGTCGSPRPAGAWA
jgi:molybdenum cofactor biosynthesis enzyme MoaA